MAFGEEFASRMIRSSFQDGTWRTPELTDVEPIPMHPSAHVLHYSSTCFEGMKAYRWKDGAVRLFRPERNIARLQASARSLCLPVPPSELLLEMIHRSVASVTDEIPAEPGSLYIRPTLLGMDSNIGGAGTPSDSALLFILLSPVGDYFTGGVRPLTLLIDDKNMRSTPRFGQVKTGGNYAAALGAVVEARNTYQADQVLFCPNGDVQETGAANFLMIHDRTILTKKLDGTVLPGVTRDSILTLAQDMGLKVNETHYTVEQLLERLPEAEAMLTGTAAVISPVGQMIFNGETIPVGNGQPGELTMALRQRLTDIQRGHSEDRHGWVKTIPASAS